MSAGLVNALSFTAYAKYGDKGEALFRDHLWGFMLLFTPSGPSTEMKFKEFVKKHSLPGFSHMGE